MRTHALEKAFVALLERIEIRAEYIALFKEVLADVWRSQRADRVRMRDQIRRRRADIEERLELLEQSFIYRHEIDRRTYHGQRDRLRGDLALLQEPAHEENESEREFNDLLAFASYIVGNVSRLWVNAAPDDKMRLQGAVVPTGIDWDGATFGTALTASIFNVLGGQNADAEGMASPRGLKDIYTIVGSAVRRAA